MSGVRIFIEARVNGGSNYELLNKEVQQMPRGLNDEAFVDLVPLSLCTQLIYG
jgi:hypothetical protein